MQESTGAEALRIGSGAKEHQENTLPPEREKNCCEMAAGRATRLREQQQQQATQTTQQQQQQQQQHNLQVTPLEEWWEVRPNSSGPNLNLVLRMFDPLCGLLSKKNELK